MLEGDHHMSTTKQQFGRIKMQVTDADITKAKQNDSMMCVVAQTIARTIPNARRISVDVQSIRWSDEEGRHTYLTPYAIQGYIVAFDAGDKIEPFSFSLDSRKAIPVKRQTTTKAGRSIGQARQTVRNKRVRQAKLEESLVADQASPTPTKTPAAVAAIRADAAAKVEEAEAQLVQVRAAYEGQQQRSNEGEGAHKAPPRVFKGARERAYGLRMLRINQPLTD